MSAKKMKLTKEQKQWWKERERVLKADDKYQYACLIELSKIYLKHYPKDARVWLIYGSVLGKLSRFNEAEISFDKALKSKSEDVKIDTWTERGHMNVRRGNLVQAEECYQKVVELIPEKSGGYVFWGVSVFRRGDLLLAEEILRRAIACKGDSVDEAYLNLGGVLLAQERYQEAAECYKKAIKIDPDYEIAKCRLKDTKRLLKLQKSKSL